jgi:dethiobiotin synthetase
MRGLFVTGTDTGCGKTTVACALARSAHAKGLRVRVLKPIETGCEAGVPADARALAQAAGDPRPVEELCPYRLALPAAPEIAARQEQVVIDPDVLQRALAAAAEEADLLLVEGAGGLRVPIAPGLEMAELALLFGLPLLVVARASLGTINHTLLTLEAATARRLTVAGVVFSHVEPKLSDADRANLDLLLASSSLPPHLELPHGADALDVDALL